MYKIVFAIILFLTSTFAAHAQKANGTIKSLIEVDEKVNYAVFKHGINNSFLKYGAADAIVFTPEPQPFSKVYTKTKEKSRDELEWKPEYARISKKGDFGFTSGRFEQTVNGKKTFGHYLHIWKNVNNKWKLAIHAKTAHPELVRETKFDYYEPKDREYYKLIGPKKIEMRNDIVFGTDELFGKRLASKNGNKYLSEFYAANVKFHFPGYYPSTNLEQALNFVVKHKLSFQSAPKGVDRAFSGDLAYTYGQAAVSGKPFPYIRVWQREEDTGKWNVIIDMYLQ